MCTIDGKLKSEASKQLGGALFRLTRATRFETRARLDAGKIIAFKCATKLAHELCI